MLAVSFKRQQNTRYKNPQLVKQHCFIASLGQTFTFFTLCDQLVAQQKHWLTGLKKVVVKSRAWVYFEQQILALLLTFHQTQLVTQQICSCCTTS